MTSSEDDDGLEDRLRRALSEAAGGVEPGSDGLDKIRSRIAGRPPRPWLVSVLFGWAERVRNWTWRGHWAWPDRLSRRVEAWWSRLRRARFPAWGTRSLALAAALAAVALIASVTLGVQPLRNAFHQAGGVLQGGAPQPATAGTEANGAPDIAPVTGSSSPGAAQGGTGTVPSDSKTPGTTKVRRAGSAACATSAVGTATTQTSLTNVRASASGTAATTPAVPASATAADSAAANASAVTCPVSATKPATATPTPTATATATASSGDWTPATDTPTPTVTDSSPWPTPTDSASSYGDGGSSPSDPPSWPGQDQQDPRPPHDPWPGHGRRH